MDGNFIGRRFTCGHFVVRHFIGGYFMGVHVMGGHFMVDISGWIFHAWNFDILGMIILELNNSKMNIS